MGVILSYCQYAHISYKSKISELELKCDKLNSRLQKTSSGLKVQNQKVLNLQKNIDIKEQRFISTSSKLSGSRSKLLHTERDLQEAHIKINDLTLQLKTQQSTHDTLYSDLQEKWSEEIKILRQS